MFFSFDILDIFILQIFWGPWNFCEND